MADEKTTKTSLEDEVKALGVKKSKVSVKRFTGKDVEKEKAKHARLIKKRTENRVQKAKDKAKQTPIKARELMIKAKLKGHKECPQRRYSDKALKYLLEELRVIKASPKHWNAVTEKGRKPYPVTPAKKKTVSQEISEMDLD